jgi:hypothetical protein
LAIGAGGGIADADDSSVENCKISGNHAGTGGGGIYMGNGGTSMGTLNLAHTRILHNDAGSLGGGVYSAGAVAAADSTISRNTAHGGGGIYYQAIEGTGSGVVLTSTAVVHNTPDNCEPPGTIPGCNS